MSLFDKRPKIEKNTFTAQDAGTVFRNAADAIDKGSLPSDISELVLQVAQLLLTVGQTFAKDR